MIQSAPISSVGALMIGYKKRCEENTTSYPKFRSWLTYEMDKMDSPTPRAYTYPVKVSGYSYQCRCYLNQIFISFHTAKFELRRSDVNNTFSAECSA